MEILTLAEAQDGDNTAAAVSPIFLVMEVIANKALLALETPDPLVEVNPAVPPTKQVAPA